MFINANVCMFVHCAFLCCHSIAMKLLNTLSQRFLNMKPTYDRVLKIINNKIFEKLKMLFLMRFLYKKNNVGRVNQDLLIFG